MAEVFQYVPWQFLAVLVLTGVLLTAIACSPTALVHWAQQFLLERKRRARIQEIEKHERQLRR